MIEANRISREHYVADERPWVSVNVSAASDLTILPDNHWLLYLKIIFRNHGNSPALGIRYKIVLVVGPDDITLVREEMGKYMSRYSGEQNNTSGFTVFPSEEIQRTEQNDGWTFAEGNKLGFKVRDRDAIGDRLVVGYVEYHSPSGVLGKTRIGKRGKTVGAAVDQAGRNRPLT